MYGYKHDVGNWHICATWKSFYQEQLAENGNLHEKWKTNYSHA